MTEFFAGPLDPRLACTLMDDLLEGLQYLRDRGPIHRDLKPSNFLLTHPGAAPGCVAKIGDYGLSKSFQDAGNSSLTNEGRFAGSLKFMAPEQITEYRFVKPPADTYSMGVSLYYLLTGKYSVEFPKQEAAGTLHSAASPPRDPIMIVLDDPPIPVLERRPDLPESLARIVDRSVRKNKKKRFQSAAEMREALRRALKDG